MKPNLSPLAASVRAELRARELTQERVGEALGIGQGAVSMRLRGKRQWRAEELLTLSETFGIPLERLYRSDHLTTVKASA